MVGHMVTEPMGEQQKATDRTTVEGETEAGGTVEAEVPLVRKRIRLMKPGEKLPAKENVTAEGTEQGREVTEQRGSEPRVIEGFGCAGGDPG